jgi:hypothetical protein
VLRTSFSDGDSFSMFIDESGTPRSQAYFLEIGRKALRALLDPSRQDIDRLRYQIVDDAVWPEALKIGTSPTLGTLVGTHRRCAGNHGMGGGDEPGRGGSEGGTIFRRQRRSCNSGHE